MSAAFTKESFDLKYTKHPNGCWEWNYTKNQDGYGRVKRNGILCSAHRVSYELYKGELNGKHVCHSCDNPACVNPDHLWLGTHTENQLDKKIKGRAVANTMPGERHPSSKLTSEQVLLIRDSFSTSSKLALEYGVSSSLITAIKSKKRWKHL